MDGEDKARLGFLYTNEEGGGSEPAVEGRVSVRADAGSFVLTSRPPPFPLASIGGVNNESVRCLERSLS